MSTNTVIRSLHDLGAAAWFGGNLMGAVGLNGASKVVSNPTDRLKTASAGWGKWAPLNTAAIGAHLVGGAGLLWANKDRLAIQQGVGASTIAKLALTAAALGTTAWSGALGAKLAEAGDAPAEGAVTPSAATPADVAKAQKQQKVLQWVTPALVGSVLVLNAQQGELQKPEEVKQGILAKLARR